MKTAEPSAPVRTYLYMLSLPFTVSDAVANSTGSPLFESKKDILTIAPLCADTDRDKAKIKATVKKILAFMLLYQASAKINLII